MRNFNLLSLPSLNQQRLLKIYEKILSGYLATFPDFLRVLSESLTQSVIRGYLALKKDLLPTPHKYFA